MTDRTFIDTKVFVYAEDARHRPSAIAQDLIQQLVREQRGTMIWTSKITETVQVRPPASAVAFRLDAVQFRVQPIGL